MSSGRRKSRFDTAPGSSRSMNEGGTPRRSMRGSMQDPSGRSFVSTNSEFPEGRIPRGSSTRSSAGYPAGRAPRGSSARSFISTSSEYPDGRVPRNSVAKEGSFKEEEIIIEEKVTVTGNVDDDEERKKRKRRRLAFIIACIMIMILIIVLIVVLVSVLGTGDAPSNTPLGGASNCGPINNETKPKTHDEFMCDMVTTLTTQEPTYLRTFPASSAYGKTIGWMTKEDETDFANTPNDIILERFVVVLFYFFTGGKDWYSKFAFLTQDHLCDWTGDSKDVIRCAFKDRKITDLGLPLNGMNGIIPTEIGYLTGLTRLYLSTNQLTGTVPTELFQLTGLEKLYLNTNDLRGKIPTEIANLKNLTTLYLNGNKLSGNLTELCDFTNSTGREFDFHADCQTGKVVCNCCETCA